MRLYTSEEISKLEDLVQASDLSHLGGMSYKDGILAMLEWINDNITTEELLDL